jgi:threonine synthase
METIDELAGLRCLDCGGRVDPGRAAGRCPDCQGPLEPTYDSLEDAHDRLLGGEPGEPSGLERFAPVLPIARDRLVTLGEGSTPLVGCPTLADEFGVDRVHLKSEGHNGTGGIADRGMALAVSAAREQGAGTVALPTTGNGGQAAAAYAARAGLDSQSFVPSRTTFTNKAMINVHGGEMTVVGGRYPDAVSAFRDAIAGEPWHSLAPFAEPYRHEGIKTLAYELVAALGKAPDAVVVPTGHGLAAVGVDRGFRELATTGGIDRRPRLYAAQAAGCAPIATAWEDGDSDPRETEHPDALCGPLEIPDPAGGTYVLDAIAETGGGAVAVPDDEILESAVTLAGAGVPVSATGGAAVAGTAALAETGAFTGDDHVVLVDPATANREADILRSHLMSKGI